MDLAQLTLVAIDLISEYQANCNKWRWGPWRPWRARLTNTRGHAALRLALKGKRTSEASQLSTIILQETKSRVEDAINTSGTRGFAKAKTSPGIRDVKYRQCVPSHWIYCLRCTPAALELIPRPRTCWQSRLEEDLTQARVWDTLRHLKALAKR